MNQPIYDVIIIGAGAAGLAAALFCQRQKMKVLLLDGKDKIGAKILMSGGNRCNVTNIEVSEKDYESESPRFVRNILRAFPPTKTIEFFKTLGVNLSLERDGKYFPTTQSAQTILDAFLKEIKKQNIPLKTNYKVNKLSFENGHFHVKGNGFTEKGDKIILCTGGLSHPNTGSDGRGYSLATSFNHSLISTSAALTPLLTSTEGWTQLRGVALPCELTLSVGAKKKISFQGPLLFTHFGISGTPVLNISRHWDRNEKSLLTANFLPSLNPDLFKKEWLQATTDHPSWQIKRFLSSQLPQRFIEFFLKLNGISESKSLNQTSKKERDLLIQKLFSTSLPITSVYGYKKAEVTAGGVNLKEVDPKTMESRQQPGLYFAGEILDVDGRIGGFNFQWAWASAYVAAQGCA